MFEKSKLNDIYLLLFKKYTIVPVFCIVSQMFNFSGQKKRVYLDYASITPIDRRVLKYMNEIAEKYPANPASIYMEGVRSAKMLESARGEVAKVLEVHSDEIIFTSGGTESNNLALVGMVQSLWRVVERTFSMKESVAVHEVGEGKDSTRDIGAGVQVTLRPHVVTTAIEHPSIRETVKFLEQNGVDVTVIPVEEDGVVLAKKIEQALRAQTVLVSVMYVNNEIGTIQPIAEIAKAMRSYKKSLGRANSSWPYLHTDACQAVCFLPLRVPALGVDLMTLDSSKFYGPRGTGILYIRRGLKMVSQIHGGDQERGRRAGTEDVVRACGFARALSIAHTERARETERVTKMRDDLLNWILENIKIPNSKIKLNGSATDRVANNINICLPGHDAEFMVLKLDAKGVAVSSVTTCQNLREESSSYVIAALGNSLDPNHANAETAIQNKKQREYYRQCAASSLRITLGRFTTPSEIEFFKKVFLNCFGSLVSKI
jgi:cysteine desulfurase